MLRSFGRTNTHPHEYCYVSSDEKFGFIRISKNASQTLSSNYKVEKWIPFKSLHSDANIFCAIRDPHQRFFSSLMESLHRCCPQDSLHTGNSFVQEDVYMSILKIDHVSPKQIIYDFIEVLSEYSWFDAHHEPQINFLFGANGELDVDPKVFLVDDIREFNEYCAAEKDINIYCNISLFGIDINKRNSVRSAKNMAESEFINICREETEANHQLCVNMHKKAVNIPTFETAFNKQTPFYLPIDHPLSRLLHMKQIDGKSIISYPSLVKLMSVYYTNFIIPLRQDKVLASNISDLYKDDIKLYKKLLELRNIRKSGCFMINLSNLVDLL